MDMSWLRPVVDTPGPIASVHLDATHVTETAEHELDLRWAEAREQLEAAGCPADVVEVIGEAVLAPTGQAGPHGRSVFATEGGIVLDTVVPAPPVATVATWGDLPSLMPVVRAMDPHVDHVVVEVDHLGGDITVVGASGEELEHEDVEGGHDEIRKVHVGGWSQRRYQNRAEDSFERNADAVITELSRVVTRHRPRLVLVAGDVTSRGIIAERAPQEVAQHLVVLDTAGGGRVAGTDPEALADAVRTEVMQARMQDMADEIARFEAERGRGEPHAEGWHAVVHAAQSAAIGTLLLVDGGVERGVDRDADGVEDMNAGSSGDTGAGAGHELWFGDQPLQLAHTESDLDSMAAEGRHRGDGLDVLLRAVIAADGQVELVEGVEGLKDGVAARLRFPLAPPTPGSAAAQALEEAATA